MHLAAAVLLMFFGKSASSAVDEPRPAVYSTYRYIAIFLTLTLGMGGHIAPLFMGGARTIFSQMGIRLALT